MTVLKDLTWDNHKKAETTSFMKRLAKKQVSPREYYVFLSNQYMMYEALERACEDAGLFDGIEHIRRKEAINADLVELESLHNFDFAKMTDAGLKYIKHIESIQGDRDKLLAHAYVRYMGDLSGGQILKRLVPGSANHYKFEEDPKELKMKFARMLKDSMAEEANLCFVMMIDFLEELENEVLKNDDI